MVHGGGWRGSDGNQLVPFAERAALEQHWAVFSVNYRLDDTDPVAWADELHDVQAAIRAIVANADTSNILPSCVLLLGASAGVNLVALVASVGTVNPVKGSAVGGAPDLKVRIRAVAEWSPPTDLGQLVPDNGTAPAACSGDLACDFAWNSSSIVDYIGCEPDACPLAYAQASPITWVSRNVAPSYVAGATNELVPFAQIQGYADKLTAAGVPTDFVSVDSTQHATQLGPWLWPSTSAFLSTYAPKPATRSSPSNWWPYPLIGALAGGGSVAMLGVVKRRKNN
jgi:acetyl esterase/lipase